MTSSDMPFQQQAAVAKGLQEQVSAVLKDAAKENDAGTLGVDGWLRTMHKLIDFQVRAFAAFLEAAIAGSWWAKPPSGEPLPSERIKVTPQNCQRKFTIIEPFVRIGLPQERIPDHLIRFEPDVLPCGAEEFRIVLRDYDFVGANYRGKVRLSATNAAPGAPLDEDLCVTVGL